MLAPGAAYPSAILHDEFLVTVVHVIEHERDRWKAVRSSVAQREEDEERAHENSHAHESVGPPA